MKEIIEVSVTQDNIDNGIRDCMNSCPVALAIKDKYYSDISEVYVELETISVDWIDGSESQYQVTEEVSDFIIDFDLWEDVMPFSFKVMKFPDVCELTDE